MIKYMWTIPNALTLARLPLALCFLFDDLPMRLCVLLLAALSDGLDGYVARRYSQTSHFGTLLDPIMDKFFAGFIMTIFWYEGRLSLPSIAALLSRDIAVLLYGAALMWQRRLMSYRVRAIWCGKITTCLQFVVFMALLLGIPIPTWLYGSFILLGLASLIELYCADPFAGCVTTE
jgi:CDP-diacylglycerol--glycerol-3-phosphate 3-phosphatidyltransferase